MRTFILAENLPYPTFKGGDLRNWQHVNALARLGEVAVFGLCSNDRRTTNPSSDIALWQTASDPALAFPPPPARIAASRKWLFETEGHPADLYYSAKAATEVERAIAQFEPDLVVVERLWLHRYIAHARRQAPRVILDAHNVEADLFRQLVGEARDTGLPTRSFRVKLAERTESIERRTVSSVDQVWVCSEQDRGRIREAYQPDAAIHVVPNGVDVPSYRAAFTPSARSSSHRPLTLVFPAMFTYAPNATAARFLIEDVWPRLRNMASDVRLLLVGGMPTPTMLEAARRDERIVVTGAVRDMRAYLNIATAVVVPLFAGSGTRFKILEALAARVPVITTRVGAEGLAVEDGTHVLLAHSGAEFAAAVRQLASDPATGKLLAHRGHELVTRCYSWEVAYATVAAAVGDLLAQDATA